MKQATLIALIASGLGLLFQFYWTVETISSIGRIENKILIFSSTIYLLSNAGLFYFFLTLYRRQQN